MGVNEWMPEFKISLKEVSPFLKLQFDHQLDKEITPDANFDHGGPKYNF